MAGEESLMLFATSTEQPGSRWGRVQWVPILLCIVAVALVTLLFACSSDDDGGATGPDNTPTDNTPPTVVSIDPPDGATSVSPSTKVTVTFSEQIDPTSLTAVTFSISGVAATVTCGGNNAVCTPSLPLSFDHTYTVTVTKGIKDKAGNAMESDFTSTFKTAVPSTGPIANAGVDIDVGLGTSTSLSGSGSLDPSSLALTYLWTQILGPPVQWTTSVTARDPGFRAPDSVSSIMVELRVNNGFEDDFDTVVVTILEDIQHAYFVSAGSNDEQGTRLAPYATIQAAVDAAHSDGNHGDVYVAAGTYQGIITLRPGVSIYGGYNDDGITTWIRDIAANVTTVQGDSTAIFGTAVDSLTLDGLTLSSSQAEAYGASSIVVSLHNGSKITISRNALIAGPGSVGEPGSAGSAALNGNAGGNGLQAQCLADRAGGAGGTSTIERAGGRGGTGKGSSSDWGVRGEGPENCGGTGGGPGACAWISANNGGAGLKGTDGLAGMDGLAGANIGALEHGGYTSDAANGGDGLSGTHGCGGGGGGGGGGDCSACCGGGGGGGGAGGQGGKGGYGGHGGGGSFGILLTACSDIFIVHNSITSGNGGDGGAGGDPGPGGIGGAGGAGGGRSPSGKLGAGGKGGAGGNGGRGGYGGGAGGGPSICIAKDFATTNVVEEDNSGSFGNPGLGGKREDEQGNSGPEGISGWLYVF
jgi:hypothetical protein